MAWRLFNSPNILWASTLISRYANPSMPIAKPSRTWINLQKGWSYCQKGILWKPAIGSYINFWRDSWFKPTISLRQLIYGPLKQSEMNASLAQYRLHNRWDFSNLSFELPDDVLHHFMSVYFPVNPSAYDHIIWGLTSNGLFTVKSSYKSSTNTPHNNSFRWIWKLKLPPKITYFLWLLCHNKLPAASYLYRLHIIPSPIAPFAIMERKRSNTFSFNVLWFLYYGRNYNLIIYPLSCLPIQFNTWLRNLIMDTNVSPSNNIPSSLLVPFDLWQIWTVRNRNIFEQI